MPQVDQWSGFDHYAGMGDNDGGDFEIPTWLSDEDERRLKAYEISKALVETVSRHYIIPEEGVDPTDFQATWREYGDAAVIVQRVAAGVLGDQPSVGVAGADDAIPDRPPLPPVPVEPESEGPGAEALRRAFEAQMEVWDASFEKIITRWIENVRTIPDKQDRQDWLTNWAETDQFIPKVLEAESEWTIPLGDSAYHVGWDPEKMRPTVDIYDPGFYFPVLSDDRASAFPKRVHLIWSKKITEGEEEKRYIRRLTWELVPVAPDENTDPSLLGIDPGLPPKYLSGSGQEGAPSAHLYGCVFTDALFPEDKFEEFDQPFEQDGEALLYPNPDGSGLVPARRFPLNIDFIPIVHIPNTLSNSDRHFGRSLLVRVAQLLNEVAGHDTDESLAGMWAARPPVAASGMTPGDGSLNLSPGQMVKLGDGASFYVVDMSKNLVGLMQRGKGLRKILSVNIEVPEGLLGHVDAADVPSGIAFVLSFTAFEQLIERLRMARNAKLALILKFVQRIAIQNDDPTLEGSTEVFPAEFRFGPYMPQDLESVANNLKLMREAGVVSQETGIKMLVKAGVPSDDAEAELAAIRAADGLNAGLIADATGSSRDAAQYMGIAYDEEASEAGVEDEGSTGGALNIGGGPDEARQVQESSA